MRPLKITVQFMRSRPKTRCSSRPRRRVSFAVPKLSVLWSRVPYLYRFRTFQLANSALRKWVQRLAQEGPQGLLDRARSGQPPKITCELEQHLNRLIAEDPLQHGAVSSQWSGRELATVLARATGVRLGRESVRSVLKKTRVAKSAGVSPPQVSRDRMPDPGETADAACAVGGGSPALGAVLARH